MGVAVFLIIKSFVCAYFLCFRSQCGVGSKGVDLVITSTLVKLVIAFVRQNRAYRFTLCWKMWCKFCTLLKEHKCLHKCPYWCHVIFFLLFILFYCFLLHFFKSCFLGEPSIPFFCSAAFGCFLTVLVMCFVFLLLL